MFIKSIELENFRSYKEKVVIPELSNVNIFIGPNSAGKSNIIEALKYFRGLIEANQVRPFIDVAFDKNTNIQIDISIKFELTTKFRDKMIDFLFTANNNVRPNDVRKTPFSQKTKKHLHNISYLCF